MLQNQLANYGDKMFDKDTAKIVRRHAFWAAIILALPLFGLDVIVFAIILWHMYSSLAQRAHKRLDTGSFCNQFCFRIYTRYWLDWLGLFSLPSILPFGKNVP